MQNLKNSHALNIYDLHKKHLEEARPSIFLALKHLFNASMLHGYTSKQLTRGLIRPVLNEHDLHVNIISIIGLLLLLLLLL